MATESHTVEPHWSLLLFASVKTTATEIRCKYAPPEIFWFPLRDAVLAKGKPKESVMPASAKHSLHGALDWEPAQQIRSVGVAEFLPLLKPLSLCTGVCQPTCNLAGGRTCGSPGCTYFFNAFYLHEMNHAVRSGAAKASRNIVSRRIIIRKQSSPKNLSRLRLLTPEYCSCVFTFALPYFSSTRSGWLSSARGDSRVAGVPHSLLGVCSSVPLRPTGIVRVHTCTEAQLSTQNLGWPRLTCNTWVGDLKHTSQRKHAEDPLRKGSPMNNGGWITQLVPIWLFSLLADCHRGPQGSPLLPAMLAPKILTCQGKRALETWPSRHQKELCHCAGCPLHLRVCRGRDRICSILQSSVTLCCYITVWNHQTVCSIPSWLNSASLNVSNDSVLF